jgi:hypothetical protein
MAHDLFYPSVAGGGSFLHGPGLAPALCGFGVVLSMQAIPIGVL